jgi:hypothetical protein
MFVFYKRQSVGKDSESDLTQSLLHGDTLEMVEMAEMVEMVATLESPETVTSSEAPVHTSLLSSSEAPVHTSLLSSTEQAPQFDPEHGFPVNDAARAACVRQWTEAQRESAVGKTTGGRGGEEEDEEEEEEEEKEKGGGGGGGEEKEERGGGAGAAKQEEEEEEEHFEATRIDYGDLEVATNNFDEASKIGEGGSCEVYKTMLFGLPCAVKVGVDKQCFYY